MTFKTWDERQKMAEALFHVYTVLGGEDTGYLSGQDWLESGGVDQLTSYVRALAGDVGREFNLTGKRKSSG